MDNPRLREFFQKCLCQKPHHVVAFNHAAICVKHKAAVKIPIPGNSRICLVCHYRLCRSGTIFHQQGIWHPVRKIAVRSVIYLDKFKRQPACQGINYRPRRTVASIDHDAQPPAAFLCPAAHTIHIHITQQMFNIILQNISLLHHACILSNQVFLLVLLRLRPAETLQLLQSAVLGNRPCPAAYQLKAIVGFGIVAGRHHDAAIQLPMGGGKINHLRAALTDIHHITACFRQPPDQCFLQ